MTNESLSAIASAVGAAISLLALALTLYHSRKHHNDSQRLSQYIAITHRVFDLDQLFIQNPMMRKYFYDDQVVDRDAEVQRVTAIAEYILDFYSTLQEHEELLKGSTPSWLEWREFIADGFRGSAFLCDYFETHSPWYEEGLMEIYRPVAKTRQEAIKRQRAALHEATPVAAVA